MSGTKIDLMLCPGHKISLILYPGHNLRSILWVINEGGEQMSMKKKTSHGRGKIKIFKYKKIQPAQWGGQYKINYLDRKF